MLTDDGPLDLAVPRDREGTFEPQLIPKHERRFTGFDDKILALYARGMTVREIQGFLADMYGVDVSPDLISTVTDGSVAEGRPGKAGRSSHVSRVFSMRAGKSRDERRAQQSRVLALAVLTAGRGHYRYDRGGGAKFG